MVNDAKSNRLILPSLIIATLSTYPPSIVDYFPEAEQGRAMTLTAAATILVVVKQPGSITENV